MSEIRTFETGATRDNVEGKPQYHGYISWKALRRFGEYMLKHQKQADGEMRSANNWKRGMPLDCYVDSLCRHTVEFNDAVEDGRVEEAEEIACAIWFNVQGWLHEQLKGKR